MEINCKFPLAHSGRQQIRTAHNPSTGPIKQTIRSLSIQKNAGVRRCVSSTAARICSSIFSVCSPTHGTFLFFFLKIFKKKVPSRPGELFKEKMSLSISIIDTAVSLLPLKSCLDLHHQMSQLLSPRSFVSA